MVAVTYDSLDRPVSATQRNLQVDGSLTPHTTNYTYDPEGRLQTEGGWWTNDAVTYSYDNAGRRTGTAVADGYSAGYGYDSLSRLQTVSGGTNNTFTYAYQGNTDLLQTLSRPNNATTSYAYNDPLKRLTQVQNYSLAGGISLYNYGYANPAHPDSRSFMESQVGNGSLHHVDYSYDTIGQLTSEISNDTAHVFRNNTGWPRSPA